MEIEMQTWLWIDTIAANVDWWMQWTNELYDEMMHLMVAELNEWCDASRNETKHDTKLTNDRNTLASLPLKQD